MRTGAYAGGALQARTPPDSATVRRQISYCLDDAFVTVGKTTELSNGGAYVRMGGRPGSQVRYVRYVDGLLFRDLQIPQGAPIVYATLRLNTLVAIGSAGCRPRLPGS